MVAMRTRLADLIGSHVLAADGEALGRVVDIVLDREGSYRVVALLVGLGAWLHRLDLGEKEGIVPAGARHRRIPWEQVDRIAGRTVHLKPDEIKPNRQESSLTAQR